MAQITRNQIRKYGKQARESVPTIVHNCGEIADAFEGYLIDYCDLPYRGEITEKYGVRHIRVGPSGKEKHYIFTIDGSLVEGYKAGEEIWIDLSFDQFCDENKEAGPIDYSYGPRDTLKEIQVIPPNDSRRSRYSYIGERL